MEQNLKECIDSLDLFTIKKTSNKIRFKASNKPVTPKNIKEHIDGSLIYQYKLGDLFYNSPSHVLDQKINEIIEHTEKNLNDNRFRSYGLSDEYLPNNVILAVDFNNGKNIKLVTKNYHVLEMDYEAWCFMVDAKSRAEVTRASVKFEYNPYTLERIFNEHEFYKTINTCEFPKYRFWAVEGKTAELNKSFKKFLSHFFEDKASHDYTMAWLYNAIHGRNQTGLTMISNQGVGKNIFSKTFKRLFGKTNVAGSDNKAFSKEFNSFMDENRVVIFDEARLGGASEKGRFKKYFNDEISIEKKGRDAKTKEIFCSLVIFTNNPKDLGVEPLDRRYSCVDLTTKNLNKVMQDDEINALIEYIENDEMFALAFYRYIEKHKDPKFKNSTPFKGKSFDEALDANLREWQRPIIELIEDGVTEGFELSELGIDWKSLPYARPDFNTINKFLKNFTLNGHRLGSLIRAKNFDNNFVKVNPKLTKQPKTKLEGEWQS